MKKLLLLILLILSAWIYPVQAQLLKVVASSGGFCENENTRMVWTLGETAVLAVTAGEMTLCAGFNQPVLAVTSTVADIDLSKNIRAYPNPARGFIDVEWKKAPRTGNILYTLHDATGRSLLQVRPENDIVRIELSDYPDGFYLLRITQSQKVVALIEIIKHK